MALHEFLDLGMVEAIGVAKYVHALIFMVAGEFDSGNHPDSRCLCKREGFGVGCGGVMIGNG